MLEYFPERRKSSTDLLPLPKVLVFRRSPSPAKRSVSEFLNPFHKRSNEDSLFFFDKHESFPKYPSKIFLSTKNKDRNMNENLFEILQSFSIRPNEDPEEDSLSFVDELCISISTEMFMQQNDEATHEVRNEKSFVVEELLSSEIIYLKQMCFILRTPFQIIDKIKHQFFPRIDTTLIFGNLPDVVRSNVSFWKDYMDYVFQALKADDKVVDIKHMITGFKSFSKHFASYKSFCMNISSNREYINKCEIESDNFRQFLEWFRNSDSSNRLGLDTFITMPFQRLTRYSLFLDRILKECGEESESEHIIQAISEVDKFVNNINKCMRVKDLTSKLHYFQNILVGIPDIEDYLHRKFPIPKYPVFNLLCPMQVKTEYEYEVRCLLHQDTLRLKQINKKTLSVKVLLFTDLIIFAKPIKKNLQCRLQLIDQPITIDQLVVYHPITAVDNASCIYFAKINQFNCFSNIFKLSNDKNSNSRNAVQILMKKFSVAKSHYESIMVQNTSNVHINITNSEDINFQNEDDSCTQENSTNLQQSGNSSISDNESDNEYLDLWNKNLASSSWIDFENTLNSCIVSDPFVHYFDPSGYNSPPYLKTSYRYSFQGYTDMLSNEKHDSIQSLNSEGSSMKLDDSLNWFRRSSLGTKEITQSPADNKY